MELICKAIKEKRKKMKLTQDELGKRVGSCYVTICNLEKGRNVETNVLRNVCRELGLKLTASDIEQDV